MKFSLGLLAATTIASAAPLRLIVISRIPAASGDVDSAFAHVRLGHAAAQAMPSAVHHFMPFSGTPLPVTKKHTGCGGSLRTKMKDMSNSWRKMFGLDPIEDFRHPDILPPGLPIIVRPSRPGGVTILPFVPSDMRREGDGTFYRRPVDQNEAHYHGRYSQTSFFHRLHRAMTILSPWEGRAISFVLGCGLGVLIRMFYVLILIIARSRKDNSSPIALVNDNEEQAPLNVVPPSYIVDEKKEHVISAEAQVPTSN